MPQYSSIIYHTKSPVLFIIFNRPDVTLQVFEQIRLVKPLRLYIAADGPRPDKPGDMALCEQTRAIVNRIDWNCEVKTLFRLENLGCKNSVPLAIDWFFRNEEAGIILEDDCLPAISFFRFCDELLKEYYNDTRVRHITGCNLQFGKKWGDASYYFSNRSHVWGWASWRRAWTDYDINLSRYNENDVREKMNNIYNDPLVVDKWHAIFKKLKSKEINSWAYSWDFINFFNNGLTIIPNANLISNIGFGSDATNTRSRENDYADIPLEEIGEIKHPVFIIPEKNADQVVFEYDFNLAETRRKNNLIKNKIKLWLKSE